MLLRSAMSGLRVLSGLRAAVETCPLWWACPTSEYDARYDSPPAYGGLSLSPDSSTCLSRVRPPCGGSRMVRCPGCPCRASGAVDPPPSFSTAGTSGASHVLRPRSSRMPRPEDAGGPAPPRHGGWACGACGSVQTLGVRNKPLRRWTSTAGDAAPPAASRRLCRRFVHRVHRSHGSAMDARRDTGGWLPLTRQGLSPGKRRQDFLGAITLRLSCAWKPQCSGGCRASAAGGCSVKGGAWHHSPGLPSSSYQSKICCKGSRPSTIRPASSYCWGAVPMCWVTPWTSRSARWSALRRCNSAKVTLRGK